MCFLYFAASRVQVHEHTNWLILIRMHANKGLKFLFVHR